MKNSNGNNFIKTIIRFHFVKLYKLRLGAHETNTAHRQYCIRNN